MKMSENKSQNQETPNVIIVTEPDSHYSDIQTFLLIGTDIYNESFCSLLTEQEPSSLVYIANQSNSTDWMLNAYNQCHYCLLDAGYNDFLTGLFIRGDKTHYYNTSTDLSMLNLRKIEDPVDFLIKLVDQEQTI
jgi:hypothetical protein